MFREAKVRKEGADLIIISGIKFNTTDYTRGYVNRLMPMELHLGGGVCNTTAYGRIEVQRVDYEKGSAEATWIIPMRYFETLTELYHCHKGLYIVGGSSNVEDYDDEEKDDEDEDLYYRSYRGLDTLYIGFEKSDDGKAIPMDKWIEDLGLSKPKANSDTTYLRKRWKDRSKKAQIGNDFNTLLDRLRTFMEEGKELIEDLKAYKEEGE